MGGPKGKEVAVSGVSPQQPSSGAVAARPPALHLGTHLVVLGLYAVGRQEARRLLRAAVLELGARGVLGTQVHRVLVRLLLALAHENAFDLDWQRVHGFEREACGFALWPCLVS